MSDTTPRPDETPGDPTAPPAESAWQPPPPPAAQPYTQPAPQQPQFGQPAAAGLRRGDPRHRGRPPNPLSPTEERTTGVLAHGVALGATVLSGGVLGFVAALVMYLIYRDRGPFVRAHSANALNIQIIAGIVMLISLPLMIVLVGFLTFGAGLAVRRHPPRHRDGQVEQRRVVDPADDAAVRQVS